MGLCQRGQDIDIGLILYTVSQIHSTLLHWQGRNHGRRLREGLGGRSMHPSPQYFEELLDACESTNRVQKLS